MNKIIKNKYLKIGDILSEIVISDLLLEIFRKLPLYFLFIGLYKGIFILFNK